MRVTTYKDVPAMCGVEVSRQGWLGRIREAQTSGLRVEEWCKPGVSIQVFRNCSTWFNGGGEGNASKVLKARKNGTVIARGTLPDGTLIELETLQMCIPGRP